MITMTLAAPLFALIPSDDRESRCAPRSVALSASSWEQVTSEMRHRFPDLAKRVLTNSDELAAGFVLVLNNAVVRRSEIAEFAAGDSLYVLPQIAGGR